MRRELLALALVGATASHGSIFEKYIDKDLLDKSTEHERIKKFKNFNPKKITEDKEVTKIYSKNFVAQKVVDLFTVSLDTSGGVKKTHRISAAYLDRAPSDKSLAKYILLTDQDFSDYKIGYSYVHPLTDKVSKNYSYLSFGGMLSKSKRFEKKSTSIEEQTSRQSKELFLSYTGNINTEYSYNLGVMHIAMDNKNANSSIDATTPYFGLNYKGGVDIAFKLGKTVENSTLNNKDIFSSIQAKKEFGNITPSLYLSSGIVAQESATEYSMNQRTDGELSQSSIRFNLSHSDGDETYGLHIGREKTVDYEENRQNLTAGVYYTIQLDGK